MFTVQRKAHVSINNTPRCFSFQLLSVIENICAAIGVAHYFPLSAKALPRVPSGYVSPVSVVCLYVYCVLVDEAKTGSKENKPDRQWRKLFCDREKRGRSLEAHNREVSRNTENEITGKQPRSGETSTSDWICRYHVTFRKQDLSATNPPRSCLSCLSPGLPPWQVACSP